MRFYLALLLNAFLLGLPLFFLLCLVPILNDAHQHGVSARDITVYEHKDRARHSFEAYDEAIPIETQRGYLLTQLGGETKFGHSTWQSLLEWGREIHHADTGDESLDEDEAVKTALRRMKGDDATSVKAGVVYNRFDSEFPLPGEHISYPRAIMCVVHAFYPNDDIVYLAAGYDQAWRPEQDHGFWIFATMFFWSTTLGIVVQWGMRWVTISLLGRVLGLPSNPLFEHYQRSMFSVWRQLLVFAIVFPVAFWLATRYMEPFYVLYLQSEFVLFAAVLWNVIFGSALFEGLENVITLFIIKAGKNPYRILWDYALVILVWIPGMLYLQNRWFSILSALALGISLNLLHKVLSKAPQVEPEVDTGVIHSQALAPEPLD